MRWIRLVIANVLIIFLAACGIGGYWMNGDPRSGKNIKPYRDYWIKQSMTEEGRKADWIECRGKADGGFSWDMRKMLPNETKDTSRLRQTSEIKACMSQGGYRYQND